MMMIMIGGNGSSIQGNGFAFVFDFRFLFFSCLLTNRIAILVFLLIELVLNSLSSKGFLVVIAFLLKHFFWVQIKGICIILGFVTLVKGLVSQIRVNR